MWKRLFIAILLFACCFLSLLPGHLYAAQVIEEARATVRVGKHADFIRIVFTSDDEFVQKASVVLTSNNVIKVTFPSPAPINSTSKGPLKNDLNYDLNKDVKITVKGNNCMLSVENLDDISVTKLSSPARLIIDARTGKASRGPSTEKPEIKIQLAMESFVIDAGHGGPDTGIRNKNFNEKDLSLLIAKDLANALGKMGKKVFLTRKSDQNLSLKKRIRLVNGKSPDMLISVHISAGNEFIVYSPLKKALKSRKDEAAKKPGKEMDNTVAIAVAQYMQDEFNISAKHEELPLALIEAVNAPAILIELPDPEKLKYDKKNREKLINALLKGMSRQTPAPPAPPAAPAGPGIEKM